MNVIDRLKRTSGMSRNVEHREGAVFLEVSDLNVRFQSQSALVDISFQVEAGERVAVVGPNGAGKSTLFKVIAGVLEADSGEVRISGHKPHGHICIAYLPQRSEVDWDFPVTVEDVVMMGRVGRLGLFRNPKASDWDFISECLNLVGMAHLRGRRINELSGGQQQRMFIAQALAQEAELLLMDEPLSGLDVPAQEEVFRILDLLEARGVTVMVATHDLGLAAERFQDVMLLNGRLLGFGPPTEVFDEARLREAYGGHLQLIPAENGTLVLADMHFDDEGETP